MQRVVCGQKLEKGSGDHYSWAKAIHVLAAVVFVGHIVVTAIWKLFADRTRERAVVEYAQYLVTLTDWVSTGSAAGLLVVLGFVSIVSIVSGKLPWLEVSWLVWGLAFFGVSGVLWTGVSIPVPVEQSRLLSTTHGEGVPEAYYALCRIWTHVGIAATLSPLVAIFGTVVKSVWRQISIHVQLQFQAQEQYFHEAHHRRGPWADTGFDRARLRCLHADRFAGDHDRLWAASGGGRNRGSIR